jgi:hypothetical protein
MIQLRREQLTVDDASIHAGQLILGLTDYPGLVAWLSR